MMTTILMLTPVVLAVVASLVKARRHWSARTALIREVVADWDLARAGHHG